MKRALPWLLGIGCVGIALGFILRGQNQAPVAATARPATAAPAGTAPPSPAPGEEKIVHSFVDQAKLEEFGRLWQQRQAMVLRMAVLQAYWNQEQTTLGQLNTKLSSDYQLDITKNYALDLEQRVLREAPAPPAPAVPALGAEVPAAPATEPAAPAQPPADASAAAPAQGPVVHTFEDQVKLEEFGQLWQQRQAMVLRMAVLQGYWNQEQAELTKLNERLSADYQVDLAKNYTLDVQRRVLIELPTPPPTPQVAPGTAAPANAQAEPAQAPSP